VIIFSAFSGAQAIKSTRAKGRPDFAFTIEALTGTFVTTTVTIVTDARPKDLCWVVRSWFALDLGLILGALITEGIIEAFAFSNAFRSGTIIKDCFSREASTSAADGVPCESVVALAD